MTSQDGTYFSHKASLSHGFKLESFLADIQGVTMKSRSLEFLISAQFFLDYGGMSIDVDIT